MSSHYQSQLGIKKEIKPKDLKMKQSFTRRLFKNLFCITQQCASKSSQIEEDDDANESVFHSDVIQSYRTRSNLSNKVTDFEAYMQLALKNENTTFTLFTNRANLSLENNVSGMFYPIVYLKRQTLQSSSNQTTQDSMCEYINKKYLKDDSFVLIQQMFPSIKLIKQSQSSKSVCIFNLLAMNASRDQETENLYEAVKQIQITNLNSQIQGLNFPEIIMSNNTQIRGTQSFDQIIICPYFKFSHYTPLIPLYMVRNYIYEKVHKIIENDPDLITKCVIILPGQADSTFISEILGKITTLFYNGVESQHILRKIQNPQLYKYVYRPNQNKKPQLIQRVKRLGLSYHSNVSNEPQMEFGDTKFYCKVVGIYENENQLQYIKVQFKLDRGKCASITSSKNQRRKISSQISTNLQKHYSQLRQFILKNIFFLDGLQKSNKFTEEDYVHLVQIVNESSNASISQCLRLLFQEDITKLNDLNYDQNLLKYYSILVGSSVITNDLELNHFQQMLLRVKGTKIMDVSFRPNYSQYLQESSQLSQYAQHQKLKNSSYSEVGGFSFDIEESQQMVGYNEIEERISYREELVSSKIRKFSQAEEIKQAKESILNFNSSALVKRKF